MPVSLGDLVEPRAGASRPKRAKGSRPQLVSLGGRPIADGSDFTSAGELDRADGPILLDAIVFGGARRPLLEAASFAVAAVETKPYRRSPSAPFITSTLQQEAARKLGFSAQRTMQVAQRLYEQGYITYMRTDSTTLSSTAIAAARANRPGSSTAPGSSPRGPAPTSGG